MIGFFNILYDRLMTLEENTITLKQIRIHVLL